MKVAREMVLRGIQLKQERKIASGADLSKNIVEINKNLVSNWNQVLDDKFSHTAFLSKEKTLSAKKRKALKDDEDRKVKI
jgi:hypothetical protein